MKREILTYVERKDYLWHVPALSMLYLHASDAFPSHFCVSKSHRQEMTQHAYGLCVDDVSFPQHASFASLVWLRVSLTGPLPTDFSLSIPTLQYLDIKIDKEHTLQSMHLPNLKGLSCYRDQFPFWSGFTSLTSLSLTSLTF